MSQRLLSDERLARRAAKGDRSAFEAIYRRYQQDLYRFCLTMTGDPQDAQEALQNAMVKVLRALPGERRQIRLKPWLYRIARNESVEVLRRRREGVEIDPELLASVDGVSELAEARERLARLFADLEQLPERQRAALVMREMAGLGFEQIGESFDTSAAVARQTVYEARLSLRQMEEGREMDCEAVTRALSDADGRTVRRRDIRAHLRGCESCRSFGDRIEQRRGEFAAIAPLPLAISAGLLQGALGAGKASAAAGAAGGGVAAKSAATVAVVAALGVTAADRGGLVDVPVLGKGDPVERSATPRANSTEPPPAPSGAVPNSGAAAPDRAGTRRSGGGKGGKAGDRRGPASRRTAGRAAESGRSATARETGHGRHRGQPEGLPPASQRGQETAAAKKPPQAATPPGPGGSGGGGEGAGPPSPASPAAKTDGPPGRSAPSPPAEHPAPRGEAVPPEHPGTRKAG